jgi:hypothetical protein
VMAGGVAPLVARGWLGVHNPPEVRFCGYDLFKPYLGK